MSQISALRKIFVKGIPLPITELQLSQGGQEVAVTLWREVALQAMKVGEWILLTHLRASNHKDFGFKLNSSVHTVITVSPLSIINIPANQDAFCTAASHSDTEIR